MKKTAYLLPALITDFVLFCIKLYIGLATSALCIYSDGINNLFDCFALLAGFAGIFLAAKPPTENYPLGFKKAENLAGFCMALIISGTGIYFVYLALERLMYPTPVAYRSLYAVLLGASLLAKLGCGIYMRSMKASHPSPVTVSVMADCFADCGITAMTLLSYLTTRFSILRADAVFGIIAGIITTINGIKLLKASAEALLDKKE